MQGTDDMQLVREYVARDSQEAFATLVSRHLNFVYSAARRQVQDCHLAEEVAQAVFLILAQKARRLGAGTVLSAWLYRTACFASRTALRAEHRRRNREQLALDMNPATEANDPDASWEQIAPLLDGAMNQLAEKDRSAVVLHFFENKNLREVGHALGTGEDAAQKRVSRAVKKLRAYFRRRDVTLSAAAVTALLSAQAVQAAPATLGVSITAAVAGHSTAAISTLTLIKGTIKLMAWTKLKISIVTGAALILALGTATVTWHALRSARLASVDLQGAWEGALAVDGADLRLVLKVAKAAPGTYTATLDSIDQGARDIPVTEFSFHNGVVLFIMAGIKGKFQGTLAQNGSEMVGTWEQMAPLPLTLKRTSNPTTLAAAPPAAALARRAGSDLQGCWKGSLAIGALKLRVVLKIAEGADGAYTGTLDSPDQGAKGLPITEINYTGPGVELNLSGIGGHFEGELNKDASELAGHWMQGGKSLPVRFQRSDPAELDTKADEGSYVWTKETDLQGNWNGTLDTGKGIKLRLAINIAKQADGSFRATMDSVDQGARGVPATSLHQTNTDVLIEWKGIGGTYMGKFESGKLTGTWQQGPASLPLALTRAQTAKP